MLATISIMSLIILDALLWRVTYHRTLIHAHNITRGGREGKNKRKSEISYNLRRIGDTSHVALALSNYQWFQ